MQITAPEQGAQIQTGSSLPGNVAIGWRSPADRTVDIAGDIWAVVDIDEKEPDTLDNGVLFSLYLNDDLLRGPEKVFHNTDYQHARLEISDIELQAGDMLYFYIDGGKSEINDLVRYHFNITDPIEQDSCQVRLADLLPGNASGKWNGSEFTWWQDLQDIGWGDWNDCDPAYNDDAWELPPGDGIKTILAQFKDGSGNISAPFRGSLVLEQEPPSPGILTINDGSGETSDADLTLHFGASDALSGLAQVSISENGGDYGEWSAYSPDLPWTVQSEPGRVSISARFKDAAGNVSDPCSAGVLDSPLFCATKQRLESSKYVDLADVSGDGLADLIAVSVRTNALNIFINQGGGKFSLDSSALPVL